jgi:hypothetical protein
MGLGTSCFGLWLSSLYHLLATYAHLAMGELSVDSLEHERSLLFFHSYVLGVKHLKGGSSMTRQHLM